MKDHQIAALVNELRDIAIEFHSTQQLRERISQVVTAALAQQDAQAVMQEPVAGMDEFLADLNRSRANYPNNARMWDGLVGEVDELRRAYAGDGDRRAEAFDVAVCAFRIATEGDAGGNALLKAPQPTAVPHGYMLVPVEPTKEMERAAFNELELPGTATENGTSMRNRVYRAMLKAAPTPPAQRVALTDEEILCMADGCTAQYHDLLEYARAVIEAYEKKNGSK